MAVKKEERKITEKIIELAAGESVKIRFAGHDEVIVVEHGDSSQKWERAVYLHSHENAKECDLLYVSET